MLEPTVLSSRSRRVATDFPDPVLELPGQPVGTYPFGRLPWLGILGVATITSRRSLRPGRSNFKLTQGRTDLKVIAVERHERIVDHARLK